MPNIIYKYYKEHIRWGFQGGKLQQARIRSLGWCSGDFFSSCFKWKRKVNGVEITVLSAMQILALPRLLPFGREYGWLGLCSVGNSGYDGVSQPL